MRLDRFTSLRGRLARAAVLRWGNHAQSLRSVIIRTGVVRAMRRLLFAACAAGLATATAKAATLDDYLADGYAVVAQTSIVGAFSGCQPNLTLTFADGTRFNCIVRSSNSTTNPRVYILAKIGSPVSAVLIGSHAYPGGISQLGTRALPRPASISTEPPTARMAPVDPNSHISRVKNVESINALQVDSSVRLNDAQNTPLPPHGPTPHK